MKTLLTLIAAACFLGTAYGQTPNPAPEYRAYDVWVGVWQYEGQSLASPLGPAGKFTGKQTVRWILNGFFLEFRWDEKGPLGDLGAVELDWYDAKTQSYPYQGFQNNGDIYSATGTVTGNVWKSTGTTTHHGTNYQTRGLSTMAADGMSVVWKNEVSSDGKTWTVFAEGKALKSTPAQAAASSEKELIQLENDWAKAYLNRDGKALGQIEAEGFVCTTADGDVVSKTEDIGDVTSGAYVATVFEMADLKVNLFGDTAVVIGRQTVKAVYKGKEDNSVYRITDTWQRRDGRWQAIASHLSKLAPPSAPVVAPTGASMSIETN